MRMILETLAAKIGFLQRIALDHCTHGAVEHQDPFSQNVPDCHRLSSLDVRFPESPKWWDAYLFHPRKRGWWELAQRRGRTEIGRAACRERAKIGSVG